METSKLIVASKISEDEKKLVERQLEVILASTYFNSAKQMQRFLEYIVKKTVTGQGNLLKQYTIGVEALGLPDDFDSDSNPIVRIMAGRVRKRLKEFYDNTSNNYIVITIPKGHYTPLFKRYSENIFPINSDHQIKDKVKEVETSTGPRIALISFTDITQSKLSNRLIQRATDLLAKELSSFLFSKFIVFNPYRDKSESYKVYPKIEADYKLYLFIEENNQHDLLCRLTDANEELLWSESYDIKSEVSLADQDDIFAKIITLIVGTHQGKVYLDWSRKLLLDKDNIPKKHQAIAYYRQFYDDLNYDTFSKAVEVCSKALERDPNDVIANILLSDLCRLDFIYRYNLIDSPLDKGVQLAEKATHLSQDSHEAHFALGRILFSQGDLDRSLEELLLARRMCRFNAYIEYGCGFYFCAMDKWDGGLKMVKRAMEMSNNYPSWYHMITSLDYYRKGKYQEAVAEAEKIVAPGIAHGPMARCIAYAKLGDITNAKNELKELASRIPKLEKNGKSTLKRFFGNEKLADQIWEGVEIALKG